jgi:hypothetical protein
MFREQKCRRCTAGMTTAVVRPLLAQASFITSATMHQELPNPPPRPRSHL